MNWDTILEIKQTCSVTVVNELLTHGWILISVLPYVPLHHNDTRGPVVYVLAKGSNVIRTEKIEEYD